MAQDHSIRIGIDSSGSVAGARQYGRAIAEIRGDTRQMVQHLGQVAEGSTRAEAAQARMGRGLGQLRGLIATLGLAALVRDAVQVTLAFERADTVFATISGSAAAGAREMAFIRAESERLGLVTVKTAVQYSQFLAAVKGTPLQGKAARDTFSAIAEALATMQIPGEQAERVIYGLTQVAGKGVVSLEEMRQQIGEQLPIALQAMARGMDVTVPKLIDMISHGQVLASVGLPALARGLREALGTDATTRIENTRAAMNRFTNDVNDMKRSLGEGFLEGLVSAMSDLRGSLSGDDVRRAARDFGELLGGALSVAAKAAGFLARNLEAVQVALAAVLAISAARYFGGLATAMLAAAGVNLAANIATIGTTITTVSPILDQYGKAIVTTTTVTAGHTAALGGVRAALASWGSGLLAFVTGPVGVALLAIGALAAAYALQRQKMQEDEEATERLRGALMSLATHYDTSTIKTREAAAAHLQNAGAIQAELDAQVQLLSAQIETGRGGPEGTPSRWLQDRMPEGMRDWLHDVNGTTLAEQKLVVVENALAESRKRLAAAWELFRRGLPAETTNAVAAATGELSKKQQRLAEQYDQTAAKLALQLAQQREVGALIRSTPYAEQEAALARLAIQHEHQVTVLENEARFAELGAGRAHALAVAIADQARAVALARLDNEEYSEGLRQLADALKEVDAAIKAIPELGRETLLGPRLEIDVESQQRVLEIVRGLQSPAEAYRREVAEVNALMARFPAYAEALQEHLARMKDEWLGYKTIAAGALRATADLARDVFSEIISGGEISWRAVADSLIRIWADAMADLLRQWIANLIRMKAAEQAAGLGSSATAGGSGGGTGGMFGSLFGKAAMGNPMTGGQWSMSAGAYAGIFAAVAAVIINQIKTSGRAHSSIAFDIGGSAGMGYSSAGSGWNTNVSAASLRSNMAAATAVMTAVNDFLREIGAEFDRTAEITGRISIGRTGQGKKTDWYVTYGAGLVRNFGRDLEAAMEFGAVQAIKMAPLKGLDPIVLRAISRSMAETMDKLREDIALATEVANIGLSGVELEIVKIRPHFDDLRKRITALLGPSIELAEALRRLSLAETNAWQSARDAITGRERTAEEDYQDRLRQAKLFNSELALRKQDIQLQIAQIDATIVRVKSGAIFNRALLEETEIFIETGRGFIRTMGGVGMAIGMASGMSQEAIDAWIKRLEDQRGTLQDILDSLPGAIDPSEILRRPRGGAGGADRTDEREALRNEAARFGLHEVRAALLDASQRHLDYAERVREAGFAAAEAADLIKKSELELARERQKIARDQRQASGEFILRGTPFGGDLITGLQDVTRESMSLQESNRALEAAGEMTLREMRELNRAIRESAERQRQDLGRQAELGLLSTLYGYLGMTEEAARLEWDLKLAGLKIAYEELKIANQIYSLNLQNLDAIGTLIGKFEAAGPPVTAPTPPAIRESQPDTRTEDIQRIREDIRDTFDDILKSLLAFRDSLKLDEQFSPLTPAQKVAEALRQYEDIQAQAARGDVEALRGREAVARTYLREFQAAYGSTAPYQEAFQRVLADTGGLIGNIDRLREDAATAAIREAGLNILEFSRQNHGNLARIIENTDPDRPRRVLVEPLPQPLPPSGPRPFLPDAGNQPGPRSAFQAASSGGGEVVEAVDRAGLSTALQLAALKKAVDALAAALSADQADRQRLQHTLERVLSGETATVQRTGTGG
jgi:tape measure domain-containing protein